MTTVPAGVDFLVSAASSAAKARFAPPVAQTRDPLDVAVAMKCITVFQTMRSSDELSRLDEESVAAPLIAAARTLQSTGQHVKRVQTPRSQETANELFVHAALAFAMHGNFPSAKAALAAVDQAFIEGSPVVHMVAAICDLSGTQSKLRATAHARVHRFIRVFGRSLRATDSKVRRVAQRASIRYFVRVALQGTIGEGSFALSGRMAALQAHRLATVNLMADAPEIPGWFVQRAVQCGILTLLPPQRQLLAVERIARISRNSLLTLPTSTGKTLVAEACMAAALPLQGLCVYVAPFVAIGEQVKKSLGEKVAGFVPLVSMFGGFKQDFPRVGRGAEIMVVTPERFDAWLRADHATNKLRTVIFDEIHILENGARGARVEGLVSRLRMMQSTNPLLRIIGLSAVLTEPQDLCRWMGVLADDLHQIGWRPTARRLAVCQSDGRLRWIHGNDALRPDGFRPNAEVSHAIDLNLPGKYRPAQYPAANEAASSDNLCAIGVDLLNRLGGPGLVVCPRKVDTRLLARRLHALGRDLTDPRLIETARVIETNHPWLEFLSRCIVRGISYHNASLPFDVRRHIEQLTRERRLTIVCATSTLAEGADLPFRWTLVAHWLSRMDGTKMKSMTFRNIAGRCGRAGAFSEGDTVLFENLMGVASLIRSKSDIARELDSVMFSSAPVESTVGPDWSELEAMPQSAIEAAFGSQLLACINEQPADEDILETLLATSYAGLRAGRAQLQQVLLAARTTILDGTAAGGPLAVMNSPITLTPLGMAANKCGFSPSSVRAMMTFLAKEHFEVGAALYASMLEAFNTFPEQGDPLLRKIFGTKDHKSPMKAGDLKVVLEQLLLPMDPRQVFENLPARKRSKAKEDFVEAQFEGFVSFVDGVVSGFLPWLLRALGSLAPYGNAAAQELAWAVMARDVETSLRQRGADTAIESLDTDD